MNKKQTVLLMITLLVTSCSRLTTSPSAPEQEAIYKDPGGLFSVTVPTDWTIESEDTYGTLTSPDEGVVVYVVVADSNDIEKAVRAAWIVVDPEFDLEPAEVTEVLAPESFEKLVVTSYSTGDERDFVLASGRLHEGTVIALLIRGKTTAVTKYTPQIQSIGSGIRVNNIPEAADSSIADLRGVDPLPLTDDLSAELEAYIIDAMDRFQVPGAAVAIVQGNEVVYVQGFGFRELGGDKPVNPETLMMIGSTTKSMTSMMMATLVDERLIDWDTPVVDILPPFAISDPDVTPNVTIRHLMCNCTGVPGKDLELIFNSEVLTPRDVVESLAQYELLGEFGETFQYSNEMVSTAGYVATMATGRGYDDLYDSYVALMQTHVLDPIGMNDSTFSFDQVRAGDNYASPHNFNLAFEHHPIPLRFEEAHLPIAPAGALWSNVLDMARFLITQLNEGISPDGTRVVSADNLTLTWEPQVTIAGSASYGLGWLVDDYRGLLMIEHGGGTFGGFTSDLTFLPEVELGIVVLTNQRASLLNQAVRFRLFELLFQQEQKVDVQLQLLYDQNKEAIAGLDKQVGERVDPEIVDPYLGTYTSDTLGEVTVTLQNGGKLLFDTGGYWNELRPKVGEDGSYLFYENPNVLGWAVTFTTDGKGSVAMTVAGNTFEKVE
jgi:CubicO group peptidase (beta-lactamase class C family)